MIRTFEMNKTQVLPAEKSEFCRILSAAVVNKRFCADLLANPLKAVAAGYSGEKFILQKDQTALLASIQVSSLSEFAAQLA